MWTKNYFDWMEDFVSKQVNYKQYETNSIEEKKEKLPKISKMFRIIKWVNNLIEHRNYKPDDYCYMRITYQDILRLPWSWNYREIAYRVEDEKERIKWKYEQDNKEKIDVIVYKIEQDSMTHSLKITYWIYKQENVYIKPEFSYWVQSYQSDIMSWIRLD